jgi:hypothetical protein
MISHNDSRRSVRSKVGIAVVLVPVLFFFLLMLFGVVMLAFDVAGGDGPFKGLSWKVPIIVAGILAVLLLLLGRIAWGLVAALAGRPVEHLLPLSAQLILSLFFGLGGLLLGVAALTGAFGHTHGRVGPGVGVAPVFLGHAWFVFQKMRGQT